MLSEEDLKRINSANKILNQRYKKLGVKELELNNSLAKKKLPKERKLGGDPFLDKQLEANSGLDSKPDLNEQSLINHNDFQSATGATPKSKKEELEKLNKIYSSPKAFAKASKSSNSAIFYIVLLVVFISLFFIFKAPLKSFVYSVVGLENPVYEELSEEFDEGFKEINLDPDEYIEKQKMFKLVGLNDRKLIISAGNFAKESEAVNYMKKLSKISGETLKIVKLGPVFTIQIGPEYRKYDYASVVFQELLKYEIENLSIRVPGARR